MRLLTHNFLKSSVKGTEKGYPLSIEVTTIRCEQQSSPDKEFLLNLLPKINYPALLKAVQELSPHCGNNEIPALPELPEILDVSNKDLDDTVIANLYRVLFDIYLVEGWLICPDTGRKFPVKDGIPNMILHEDEI